MDGLQTLLIANRGEIATRIIKTARILEVRTIAIYTNADAASMHVALANEAVLLAGDDANAYIDGEQIIEIAKRFHVDAIIPGYGFLSENADFALSVSRAGMVFVGPSPESISSFGLKHTARELAARAGVPIVPGTKDLITSAEEAVLKASKLGYPVMLKATAGGGGAGLMVCTYDKEVRQCFATIKSRGKTLFKNAGVFMERYYSSSRHIEVQIFGNGLGQAIHFGERECSIQRRHQKVIEECPSPFVMKHPWLREKLGAAAIRLAESINYASAGTIEYLVDDATGDFFFLEMNTRLQVEHGITELCYGVDLVELMLKQADAQLLGSGGLESGYLKSLQIATPKGWAIEARVYAENPAKNFSPSPGTLQAVEWQETPGSRIDTWVKTGTRITSFYDPLLAKVMYHSGSRDDTIHGLRTMLLNSQICGPPTNLHFLSCILESPDFRTGMTLTKFLDNFEYTPCAIDVLAGGSYTLVQDYPGRPTMGKGFPHSGPMDALAFRMANLLAGNAQGAEGLEITLTGPDLLFLGPAVVALCGASFDAKLDAQPFPLWTRVHVRAGQRLRIGKVSGGGCRAYLAVYGGFPMIAKWFGSKATSPIVGVGGYQGRQLVAGDYLALTTDDLGHLKEPISIPSQLRPLYSHDWELMTIVGPYDEGYLTTDFIERFYETTWKISHNAARGGIRLIGPKPQWARQNGGEGGAHPSNLIEYGYSMGTLNWTGDDPCLFAMDCPDLGGFVSSTTVIKADYWRMGQMSAGDSLKFKRVSLADALSARRHLEDFVAQIAHCCSNALTFEAVSPLNYSSKPDPAENGSQSKALVHYVDETKTQPSVSYRQGADDYLLVEYGHGTFDLNHRCRVTALIKALNESEGDITFSTGLINTVGCGSSLLIYYDGLVISQADLISHLCKLETELGDLSNAQVPSRLFKLPLTLNSKKQTEALQRYMDTQRPYASYLPDNMDFVARNNAFTLEELKGIYFTASFLIIAVGFFTALPLALAVDPRRRMNAPKMNPSRVWTPEGQLSWGGSCLALYNVESPGGFQLTGLTIPGVDILGSKKGYSTSRPWLFEDFDQLTFYEVSEEEYERQLALFHSGRYEYQVEDVMFDMKEHNRLLRDTKDEVADIRKRQKQAQIEMELLEKESMEKWLAEQAKASISVDEIQSLMNDPKIKAIESPLNANVWKVCVAEGDIIPANEMVAILEAMKMEIDVRADMDMAGGKVEKVLVKPNDIVDAGTPLVLVRCR